MGISQRYFRPHLVSRLLSVRMSIIHGKYMHAKALYIHRDHLRLLLVLIDVVCLEFSS